MEYSADDIAGCSSKELAVLYTTLWTYDYVCSIHEEWTYLLQSHWGRMKGMYIVTRYLPFILLATDLYRAFRSSTHRADYQLTLVFHISSGTCMLVICSEWFFILRTYVHWDNNGFLLAAMLSTFFHFFSFLHTLIVFSPGLMILTFIRAIQNWRTNLNHLYTILVNHNLSYYACGLLFSAANIFTSLLFHDAYQTILDGYFMILAILATRMYLYLWQVNRQTHGSGDFTHVPMSDLSFATSTA
ncbi:uncharacterized protein HD556DRAFT_1395743 [Suillus plorans]|uniref:DUF6533 domain-containing protein n=1 Tax=Suillus plorans TaxID=116603 RepID=A0A9P7DEU9_9AGAM|nr:uncharacterized protein HD556DRAFT_1395743 [Suillus plorans]KAG1789694.1 hypothetical protein HD556DRAFT_1395743 [Suillus plorans]